VRERASLAPARHAPIDQPRILAEHDVRTQPESFHDAWAKPFEQSVGFFCQRQNVLALARVVEVSGDARPTAAGDRIGTDVSRDRRVIPFRDDGPLRAVSPKERIPS